MNSRKILGLFFIVLLISGYTEYNSYDQAIWSKDNNLIV